MDRDELRRFAKRFQDRMTFARPPQKPKLGLPLIETARRYQEAFTAAEIARRELAAHAVRRCPDPAEALDALNYLAQSFGLPPFTEDDVTR
jgi:hypothetical protein